MNDLSQTGLRFVPYGLEEDVTCSAKAIVCTADLPAKADMLCMNHHNGKFSCLVCEEPDRQVARGRGHVHAIPFNRALQKRTNESFVRNAHQAVTSSQTVKGIKSACPLLLLNDFYPVTAAVIDYLHCVLLGVTKSLLHRWTDVSSRGCPYFIRDDIDTVDERLRNIHPPDFVRRFSREIGKWLPNWKASEYRSWLLYYGIPCLQGILPTMYLRNFCPFG
ncbi:uncharacterized protein LOC134179161 [Corticium candelabrum]|uniref:uncharacterized protein LOC134179161 n=1 Tax=Corticium candelabrum TaxID=121492 RepID=UPI002E25EDF0|nr:uncharacterized protein LOC134179161 [Corticium candelabrum]